MKESETIPEQVDQKMIEEIWRELEDRGYIMVKQNPDVSATSVTVDDQIVEVPFTNISGLHVVLKPDGEGWQFVARGFKKSTGFNSELRIAHEVEFGNIEEESTEETT